MVDYIEVIQTSKSSGKKSESDKIDKDNDFLLLNQNYSANFKKNVRSSDEEEQEKKPESLMLKSIQDVENSEKNLVKDYQFQNILF